MSLLTMRVRVWATAAAVVASLIPAAVAASSASASPAAAADLVPRYDHIAVIMFTDHDLSNILGNKYAPTFNKLAREYGLATHYYTTSDPDVAGEMAFLAGNSYGIDDSLPYWDEQVNKPSLLSQLDTAHKSWKEYVQDIPYAGYLGDCYPTVCLEWDTLYKQEKFNAVPDLTSVADNPAEARKMVPAAELGTDAKTGHLPDFSFIDANECTNMHGGPPFCQDSPNNLGQRNDTKLVAQGDAYLKQVTREIMSGPQWRHGNNAIVITETEGNTTSGCCDAKPGTGRVLTVVITSHGPRHLIDRTPFNHYSLLATVEHAFGLGCLQFACDTKHVIPMAKLFGATKDGPEGFPRKGSDPVVKSATAAVKPASAVSASAVVKPASAVSASVVSASVVSASAVSASAEPASVKPAAAAETSPWQVVTSPDRGSNDNDLWSISGRSPSDIWAVGSLLPNANATIVRNLTLHYNGTKWMRVKTPDVGSEQNFLFGVAALPDGSAWATGTYTVASGHTDKALTMHWNGTAWAIVKAANPGSTENMLYSAVGVSDSDVWAVGTYGNKAGFFFPLIEHWNGTRWCAVRIRGLPAGTHGVLSEVTSGAGGTWATGQISGSSSDSQVVLHLVGRTWTVVHEPAVRTPAGAVADAYPQAIATSPTGVWVAGRDRSGHAGFSTFVEAPAGTGPSAGSLSQVSTPDPTTQDNYLWGIAPVNDGANAWGVGTSFPPSTGNGNSLIEYGSATGGWTVVPSPDPSASGNNILDGVLAFGSDNVWAVGEYDGSGGMKTLIMHYTGGTI